MKCVQHSDQICTEACRGCGRLMCEVCDVLYAGKHYCKACVGTIAQPLRRFVPYKRSKAMAFVDKLISRWYAIALVSVGLFVLFSGVLLVELPDKHASSYFEFHQLPTGGTYSGQSIMPGVSKTLASVVIEIGAALVLAGAYFYARRFSLRWLLGGIAAVAALSAYPFLRISGHPELTHKVTVTTPAKLTPVSLQRMTTLLQPDAAAGTLAPAMLQELGLHPGSIRSVTVARLHDRGVRCLIEFSNDITDEQRNTLSQFYDRYVVELACHNSMTLAPYPGSVWNKYEAEWLTREAGLLNPEAQTAQ